jgi:ABC-type amino acid transport substrate-binding protein
MKRLSLLALVLSLVAVLLAGIAFLRSGSTSGEVKPQETVSERVMRTGTLRCAYFIWRPYFNKDPNTGALSGIVPDLFAEIGKRLNLKVEFVEEVTLAQMFEGFANNRYDAICGPLTPTPERARAADFVDPFVFAVLNAYSRVDDARFDEGTATINTPETRIAVIDGEFVSMFAPQRYPDAKILSAPDAIDGSQLLLQVVTNKADIVLVDPPSFRSFAANNPDKLREVPGGGVAFLPVAFALPRGEYPLKSMLNTSVSYLNAIGFLGKLLQKYEIPSSDLRLPATATESAD